MKPTEYFINPIMPFMMDDSFSSDEKLQFIEAAMESYADQFQQAATPQTGMERPVQIKMDDTVFTHLRDGAIQIATKNGCIELYSDEVKELVKFIGTPAPGIDIAKVVEVMDKFKKFSPIAEAVIEQIKHELQSLPASSGDGWISTSEPPKTDCKVLVLDYYGEYGIYLHSTRFTSSLKEMFEYWQPLPEKPKN